MRTGCHYLVCRCVCVCVTFVVFTDCDSCTRPISTNRGSMEAGEYALTRGTCFLACRLELDAVAGLLWISWCVLSGADFSGGGFDFFSFKRTRPAASMRPPCLIRLCTSNEARPRERSDRGRFLPKAKKPLHNETRPRERSYRGRFLPIGKKASSYRGAYRVPLFSLSVCVRVCSIRRFN